MGFRKGDSKALFYARTTQQNNWSRAVLSIQIESRLYQRQGKAIDNFQETLPLPQADLARETLKNPYNFEDFYLDMLFYHTRLRCYVVAEIKVTEFKPEYAGKLNFYLNVVNAQLKHAHDQPGIGILLCKTPNKLIVEYALENISSPGPSIY